MRVGAAAWAGVFILIAGCASKEAASVATVRVNVTGPGSVTSADGNIRCPSSHCTEGVPLGATVDLVATADDSARLTDISGACGGVSPECVVVADDSKTVSFTFEDTGGGAVQWVESIPADPAGALGVTQLARAGGSTGELWLAGVAKGETRSRRAGVEALPGGVNRTLPRAIRE